jgi:hypothetical protein
MIRSRTLRARPGYTLTIVLVTVMLLFAIWSFAMRTTSSLVRIETNRVLQQERDQGAMNALGQALQLLQYSTPSNSNRTVFTYGVTINVPNTSGGCTPIAYTILYTAPGNYTPPPNLDSSHWQVQVYPGSSPVTLPSIGASPQWP